MFLDIVYIVILFFAVVKGYRRGIIVGVFSLLAFIIGLVAALKLSVCVAAWLHNYSGVSSAWLPFFTFMIVFFSVAFLVKMTAKILHETAKILMLGWMDKLGGIILYFLIYTLIYSVFLFFATYIHLVNQNMIEYSKSYSFVEPFGQKIINKIGDWLPWFKDMFIKLEIFFQPGNHIQNSVTVIFNNVHGVI